MVIVMIRGRRMKEATWLEYLEWLDNPKLTHTFNVEERYHARASASRFLRDRKKKKNE